jgi:5-methylcytosine-specific restriction endonuclease McrA
MCYRGWITERLLPAPVAARTLHRPLARDARLVALFHANIRSIWASANMTGRRSSDTIVRATRWLNAAQSLATRRMPGIKLSHEARSPRRRHRTAEARGAMTGERCNVTTTKAIHIGSAESASASRRSRGTRRSLEAGLLQNRCQECGLSEWRGKRLSIQINHINGIKNDNRLENLRMLCPNCHSQTETFASRNRRKLRIIPG